MTNRFASAILLGLAMAQPQTAAAQSMLCGARDVVVGELTGRYGEQIRGMGLSSQDRIVEVYVSEETGSWTITVTAPNGTTCLMAAGRHFAAVEPEPVGEDL